MDWTDLDLPSAHPAEVTVFQVIHGPSIPPQQRLLTYSPGQWEDFVQEWAHYCLKKVYVQVQRFSGAGDMGIDVAGFVDEKRLQGVWDNYQCKHYDHALWPGDVWAEFGKIIWYSFKGEYVPLVATTSCLHGALAPSLIGCWKSEAAERGADCELG